MKIFIRSAVATKAVTAYIMSHTTKQRNSTMREITPEDRKNAKKLKNIWEKKKKELGLTQAEAAKKMGFRSQGTVAQYLNEHIALNYEAVIAFAKLLRVEPWEIDPKLGSLRISKSLKEEKTGQSVTVLRTLSGDGEPTRSAVAIKYRLSVGQCYGIEVDSDDYRPFAKRGSILIASRVEEAITGDDVLITMDDNSIVAGELHYSPKKKEYITRHSAKETEEITHEKIKRMDPIVAISQPEVERPRRYPPSTNG